MGVITFLIILAVIVVVIGGSVLFATGRDDRVLGLRESKKELTSKYNSARLRERAATRALRKIANGSGDPMLEAQIALDEIESLEMKELN